MKNIDKPFSSEALRDVLLNLLGERLGLSLTVPFVVAYSGGRDSHVLLHALCALRAACRIRIQAVHVDHALQPASREWSEHCLRVCAALDAPCTVERVRVERRGEESIEAAARRLRYERLAAHVNDGAVLLTAHHQDDQAETVLLALLRGAGVHGLAAMPSVVNFGAGQHVRPLLGFSRDAIDAYARTHGLTWIDDASNRDERMSRNFLRAQVLPLLKQRWPAASRAMARAASHNADASGLLDDIAQSDLARCGNDDATLSVLRLSALAPARQRNLVRFWIRRNGFYPPSSQHLEAILDQANHSSRSGSACIAWPGAEVRRYRDQLVITANAATLDGDVSLVWRPPQTLDIPETGWRLRATTTQGAGLSQQRVANATLTVRLRQGGEVCQLVGRDHHHKVKKLLQEAGVPPWERERLPLIYAGDELAAVGDRWVCAPFAAQPNEPGWQIVLEPLK